MKRPSNDQSSARIDWPVRAGKISLFVVTQDNFNEEVSVVFNVRGKGLVVITSCAHRGVINILKYAQQITGVSTIAAQIGGWHTQNAPQTVVGPMIADFQALNVVNIVPIRGLSPNGGTTGVRKPS
jgi:metal-dependent hydrolase (beta-lactamase superfamily II)